MQAFLNLRTWMRENPWIWLVLIYLLFLSANAVFLKIAFSMPFEIIGK